MGCIDWVAFNINLIWVGLTNYYFWFIKYTNDNILCILQHILFLMRLYIYYASILWTKSIKKATLCWDLSFLDALNSYIWHDHYHTKHIKLEAIRHFKNIIFKKTFKFINQQKCYLQNQYNTKFSFKMYYESCKKILN